MLQCEKSSSLGSGLTTDFHVCVDSLFCVVQIFLKEKLTVWKSCGTAWQSATEVWSLRILSPLGRRGRGPFPGREWVKPSEIKQSSSCAQFTHCRLRMSS